MQKVLIYIGSSILTIALLFGGGFLTGRLTADKQPSQTSSEYSGEISRIVELTRGYLTTRTGEFKQREVSISERERFLREAESRSKSDRDDLTELERILSNIIGLSEAK